MVVGAVVVLAIVVVVVRSGGGGSSDSSNSNSSSSSSSSSRRNSSSRSSGGGGSSSSTSSTSSGSGSILFLLRVCRLQVKPLQKGQVSRVSNRSVNTHHHQQITHTLQDRTGCESDATGFQQCRPTTMLYGATAPTAVPVIVAVVKIKNKNSERELTAGVLKKNQKHTEG